MREYLMQRLCLSMNVLYQLMAIPILGHWFGVLAAKGLGWPLSEIAGYTFVPTLSVIVIAILVPEFVRQSETNQKNLSQGPRASFGKPGFGAAVGLGSLVGGLVLSSQGEASSAAWAIGLALGMLASLGLAVIGLRAIESQG
jgi:hypothetical protein